MCSAWHYWSFGSARVDTTTASFHMAITGDSLASHEHEPQSLDSLTHGIQLYHLVFAQ